MRKEAVPDVSVAEAEEVLRREFVDLAFNRLKLDRGVTPDQVERVMGAIDSGALDGFIQSAVPAEHLRSGEEMYADWKKRDGVDE